MSMFGISLKDDTKPRLALDGYFAISNRSRAGSVSWNGLTEASPPGMVLLVDSTQVLKVEMGVYLGSADVAVAQ